MGVPGEDEVGAIGGHAVEDPEVWRMGDTESQVGGLGLLANWITVGIWAPMHVKITCGAK